METLHLDFIPRPAAGSRLGIGLLLIGIVLAGAAVLDDSSSSAELEQLQSRAKRAESVLRRLEDASAAADAPAQRSRSALAAGLSSAMVARLLTPWGVLFDGLEQAHNDDIALLRVEPDAQRGRLLLGGEARKWAPWSAMSQPSKATAACRMSAW